MFELEGIDHVALAARDVERRGVAFERAQRDLTARSVAFQFHDHEICPSIYFQYPNDHELEITTSDV